MSDENITTESTEIADENEKNHFVALAAKLDAIIEGAPNTITGSSPTQPAQMRFKTRKIYNRGSKANPRYVITFDAQVYGQPDGFVAKGDRIDVALLDDKGFLVDAAGGIWLNEGENDGCGARCPGTLRDQPLNVIMDTLGEQVNADAKSALMLCVQAHGPSVQLIKIWRSLSHAHRNEMIRVLVPRTT